MAKINHECIQRRFVEFRSLKIGGVFKLDPDDGLLMKLQPGSDDPEWNVSKAHNLPRGPNEVVHGMAPHNYWRPGTFPFWNYRDDRFRKHGPRNPGQCNAVYITGKTNTGFLVDFDGGKLVLSAKVCDLKTEF